MDISGGVGTTTSTTTSSKDAYCCSQLSGNMVSEFIHGVPLKEITPIFKALDGLTIVDANTGCGCNLAALMNDTKIKTHHVFAAEPRKECGEVETCVAENKLRYIPLQMDMKHLHQYIQQPRFKVNMTEIGLVIIYPFPSTGNEVAEDYESLVLFQPKKAVLFVGCYIEDGKGQSCAGSFTLWSKCLNLLRFQEQLSVTIGKHNYEMTQCNPYKLENGKELYGTDIRTLPENERHLFFECILLSRM